MNCPMLDCYVLGCHEPMWIAVRHKRFGLVVSCEDHNPINHDNNRALITGLIIPKSGGTFQPPLSSYSVSEGKKVKVTV